MDVERRDSDRPKVDRLGSRQVEDDDGFAFPGVARRLGDTDRGDLVDRDGEENLDAENRIPTAQADRVGTARDGADVGRTALTAAPGDLGCTVFVHVYTLGPDLHAHIRAVAERCAERPQPGSRRARQSPSARNALRMTATSIASCRSAPAIGAISPAAAKPIATRLIPMPARTLCLAIDSERRPIRTAATTRSTRSCTMTASAVSEATVAPTTPIAIPTSATASAGASLMPSPTITTTWFPGCCCRARTTSAFSPGLRS